jgi:hypothetical protein
MPTMGVMQARWRRRVSLAVLLGVMAVIAVASLVLAAEPTTAPIPLPGGDPRSDGAGPGIVGSPLLILAAVVLLGVATAIVTVVIARLAQRR